MNQLIRELSEDLAVERGFRYGFNRVNPAVKYVGAVRRLLRPEPRANGLGPLVP